MKVDEKLIKVEKVTFKSCLFPGPDFRPYHPVISWNWVDSESIQANLEPRWLPDIYPKSRVSETKRTP